ncbi:hypothetical protein EI94DRAFT_27491 [Lactarius quietus]|nr:hypothetical protein EI94DRAFT_27491 [Lactarius quietus]
MAARSRRFPRFYRQCICIPCSVVAFLGSMDAVSLHREQGFKRPAVMNLEIFQKRASTDTGCSRQNLQKRSVEVDRHSENHRRCHACRLGSSATRHLVGNELKMVIFTFLRLHAFGSLAARYSSACGTTPSWDLEAIILLESVLLCLEITLG